MWLSLRDRVHSSSPKCNWLIKITPPKTVLVGTGCITYFLITHTVTLEGFSLIPAII